jgi:hypothetical protein
MISLLVVVGVFAVLAWNMLRNDHEFGSVG